jgi:hypothetical protein
MKFASRVKLASPKSIKFIYAVQEYITLTCVTYFVNPIKNTCDSKNK